MISLAIRSILAAAAPVTSLLGTGPQGEAAIHCDYNPQGTAEPRIVITEDDDTPMAALALHTSMRQSTIEIVIRSRRRVTSETIADAVENAMNECYDTAAGKTLKSVIHRGRYLEMETAVDGTDAPILVTRIVYDTMHRNST